MAEETPFSTALWLQKREMLNNSDSARSSKNSRLYVSLWCQYTTTIHTGTRFVLFTLNGQTDLLHEPP